jgi:hypothetical protein
MYNLNTGYSPWHYFTLFYFSLDLRDQVQCKKLVDDEINVVTDNSVRNLLNSVSLQVKVLKLAQPLAVVIR